MHLFRDEGVRDYGPAARLIPVIDYGPCFDGVPGALDRVAVEVAHACQNVGFFYALNHGVPEELISPTRHPRRHDGLFRRGEDDVRPDVAPLCRGARP
jgi:non-haem dioxygenase in morphine synthesis N-terminal